MLTADNGKGSRIEAFPGAEGWCPGCRESLVPKCGEIKIWHWSHRALDCDPWYEPECQWHLGWKRLVGLDKCEVVMGPHRADIVSSIGTVIELQHSTISISDAWERERFYGKMVWLFDATTFADNVVLYRSDKGHKGQSYTTFRWKHPRQTHVRLRKPRYWDFGEEMGILDVRQIYPDIPCGGWGYWITREQFLDRFFPQGGTSQGRLFG